MKSNDSQYKNNSNGEQTHSIHTLKKKKSIFHYNSKPNFNQKNCLILLFTIFSIVIPIGIQPQLQANNAFAEINSQWINDEDEYTDEGEITSHSSASETKSKLNQKDPFGFSDEDNKKVKLNIIIPDVVGPDLLPGTQSSTPSSHQIDTDSSEEVHPNSIYKNSSDIDNADGSIIAREDKPATGELSSTDSHIGTVNNNESKNVSEGNSIVSDDKPGTENSQSQLTPQPKYKSYRDYIENSSASKNNDNVIISDDKVGTELNTTNSGINSVIGNPNDNANENLVVSDNQSNTNQLQSTDSQSQLTPQPGFKSYHDYVVNNNLSNHDINVTGDTQATGSSSIDSQMDSDNRNINNNGDDKLNEVVILPEDELTNSNRSSEFQVDNQSSNSNSTIGSQPLYKSYRDFVEHNNASKNANNDNTMSSKSTIEPSSATAASSQVTAQSSSKVYGDFNGDGRDDLAIGVPGENEGAGAVNVLYGSSSGLSATSPRDDQFWTQSSPDLNDDPQSDDNFGSSLASGDFNGDGKDDLAIGVQGEDLDSISDVGAVEVIYGSSSGLSANSPRADQFWTQDSADVNDGKEANDNFGSSLTSGDFNGDGRDDLAIGVPGENEGAGAVNVLYGSSNGLSATSPRSDQLWTQNSPDVNDVSEASDNFGSSLGSGDFNGDGRDDLAIGAPDEDLTVEKGQAGGVEVIYGSSSGLSATSPRTDQFWTQDSANIDGIAEHNDAFGWSLGSGDFNGDGEDDLAIGARWENINSHSEAGAVQVIYGSSSGLSATSPRADQFWNQDTTNVNDVVESEDQFGFSVSSGDFNGDGKDDLAIGVPFDDIGSVFEPGAVEVIYGSSSGLSATSPLADQFWTQNSADINDVTESGDDFGVAVYSGDFNGDGRDDLAIGVPKEDVDTGAGTVSSAGAVNVIYGSSTGLSATSSHSDQFWTQSTTNVDDVSEGGDSFGDTLG
jgi:FG-GAP repeat